MAGRNASPRDPSIGPPHERDGGGGCQRPEDAAAPPQDGGKAFPEHPAIEVLSGKKRRTVRSSPERGLGGPEARRWVRPRARLPW